MLKRITCGVLMKKLFLYILLPAVVSTFSACSIEKMEEEKKRDLAYTVIEQDEMPQELKEQIEKEEKNVFGITYADQGILYAARGFGEKKTDGYHVEVTACYETEDTIYVTTELRGPQKGENIKKEKNCPYVVIKMDYEEKQVMFL